MIQKLILWLLANSILPILIPVVCLCIPPLFNVSEFPFQKNFLKLLSDGFYIFSALALILSLIEDWKVLNFCTKFYDGIIMTLFLGATCIMFCLIEANSNSNSYIDEHLVTFITIWFGTAGYATYIKYRILSHYKKTSQQ